jgi:hypothetical protein
MEDMTMTKRLLLQDTRKELQRAQAGYDRAERENDLIALIDYSHDIGLATGLLIALENDGNVAFYRAIEQVA